jgi:fumarate reductase flavoprotein subunit
MVAASSILVTKDGKRFCDEGEGGIYQTNAIAKLDDPSGAAVIFDEAIWDGPGRQFLLPANPHLPDAGGEIIEAASLDQLAGKLGVDAGQLTATVESYNAACRQGNWAALSPPRRGDLYKAMPIVGPKFMAVRVCAGLTYTMGGIATDEFGQVLHQNGDIIAGLYAVGSTTGGLEGGPHAGYSGGLSKSLIFGLRAAEAIAASAQQKQKS